MKLSIEPIREMLDFNYDRRERLFDFAATLPPEELTRPVPTTWGSFLGILLHCVEVEESWVRHVVLGEEYQTFQLDNYPGLAAVRHLASEVRERTVAFVDALSPDDLEREIVHEWEPGNTTRCTVSGALFHVVTHETYHRGQALLLAMQMGHDVPDLDYYII